MREVQEALRAAGLSVWTDEGLEPGTQSWQDAIAEAVEQGAGDGGPAFPERKSLSTGLNNEVGYAQTLKKRIFPLLLRAMPPLPCHISLINAQWVDGRAALQPAVAQDLLPALRRYFHLPEPATPAPARHPDRCTCSAVIPDRNCCPCYAAPNAGCLALMRSLPA